VWRPHGPKITVRSPANHVVYRGPLPISVSAASSEGVFRIRLEIDGKLIRNYDSNDFAPRSLARWTGWEPNAFPTAGTR